MSALRSGKLLSAEMTRLVTSPQVVVNDNVRYGYGPVFVLNGEDVVRYGHTGEDPGVSARLMYFPGTNTDVVILANLSDCTGPVLKMVDEILTNG
jgi:CubicO group peptidase (beta-lactamase class C family)